jgi:hypothetical protein
MLGAPLPDATPTGVVATTLISLSETELCACATHGSSATEAKRLYRSERMDSFLTRDRFLIATLR